MGLLGPLRRCSATVTALTKVTTRALGRRDFLTLLARTPRLALAVAEVSDRRHSQNATVDAGAGAPRRTGARGRGKIR